MDPPAAQDDTDPAANVTADHRSPCPCCGGHMIIVETFERGGAPRGAAITPNRRQDRDVMT
jgi:hypothetical protein